MYVVFVAVFRHAFGGFVFFDVLVCFCEDDLLFCIEFLNLLLVYPVHNWLYGYRLEFPVVVGGGVVLVIV